MRSDLAVPLRLAAAYVLFSLLWMLGGEYLLAPMVDKTYGDGTLHQLEDLLFVIISTVLIFVIIHRDRRSQRNLVDALSRNSRLLQQAQRNAALGSWEYIGTLHLSQEALRLFGKDTSHSHTSLDTLLTWLHPAERAAVQRAFRALLDSCTPLSIGARLYRPQASDECWLMLRGEVDGSGQVLGTVQDISLQKRDEQALRESEQRFRQLFEHTPRIAVQGYDRDRRVIYWNQASTQLYGYSLQDAMGKRLEDLIIPPAQRSQVINAINTWLVGGPPIPAGELQLQRKDGRKVWVYSSHTMLRNNRNQLELYCVDIDLSEQRAIHGELQDSETRYRELVENLSDAIVMTDASTYLLFANPAWETISGYRVHESLGKQLPQFLIDEDAARLRAQLAEMPSCKGSLRGEYQLLSRNGQQRRVELHLHRNPLNGSMRGSVRDIQERYQQQQLQHARNAVLDELLARHPLDRILDGISRRLQDLNPRMRVSVMLVNEDNTLHVAASPSIDERYRLAIEGVTAAEGVGSCGHAVHSGELVIAEDLSNHPYWVDYHELAGSCGLRACWSLPFKDDQGAVLGTFGIYYNHPTRPSAADIALVTEFTRLAGLAVQQARNAVRPMA